MSRKHTFKTLLSVATRVYKAEIKRGQSRALALGTVEIELDALTSDKFLVDCVICDV